MSLNNRKKKKNFQHYIQNFVLTVSRPISMPIKTKTAEGINLCQLNNKKIVLNNAPCWK